MTGIRSAKKSLGLERNFKVNGNVMQKIIHNLLIFIGLLVISCEKFTDFDNPASIEVAKNRSEYIILCIPQQKNGSTVYSLEEILYKKQGSEVPWKPSEIVTAPQVKTKKVQITPDKAVIFYEVINGQIRVSEIQLFYISLSSTNDAEKLERLITEIKK